MKISFENGVDDIVAFSRYHYDTDPTVRKQIRRARFLSPLFLIAAGLVLFFEHDRDWKALIIFGSLSLLWIAFWPMYSRARWAKRVRREINQPENSNWFGHDSMETSDEQVRFISEKGDQNLRWDLFIKSGETENHFFLFIAKNQAVTIPKRDLSPSQIDELRSLFAKHIAVNISETKNKK